jgi:Fungal specific transcription factor domain
MRTLFEKKETNEGEDASKNIEGSSTPGSGDKTGSGGSLAGQTEPVHQMNLDWTGAPYHAPSGTPTPYSPDSDVVDRGVISLEEATQLFHSYNNHLVQFFPTVQFPPEITIAEIRSTKPTLFLAAIAAASGKEGSHLYSILNTEVLSAYAHRTVIQGEKSLELVQALIITSVWYYPPGRFAQLKFYEYIHMAATMALDIGLGTNPKTFKSRRRAEAEREASPVVELDDEEMEKRRTFLVCYLITTG